MAPLTKVTSRKLLPRDLWVRGRVCGLAVGQIVALLMLVTGAIGCADARPTRVPVSGRVLIDGQPVTQGHVRFVPTNARPSIGELDSEGRFTLTCFDGDDGAVTGTHRVEVIAAEELSATTMHWHAPKKYSQFDTSGLIVQLDGPRDDLVIELTWDGAKPYTERFGR